MSNYNWETSPLSWCVKKPKIDWTPLAEYLNIDLSIIESCEKHYPFTEEWFKDHYVPGSICFPEAITLYILSYLIPNAPMTIMEAGACVGMSTKHLYEGMWKGYPCSWLYSIEIIPFGTNIVKTFPEEYRTPAVQNGLITRACLLTEEEQEKIHFITSDIVSWLEQYNDEPFDLAFEDTDHTYNTTKRVLELLTQKVKKGGLIISHDIGGGPVKEAWDDIFGNYLVFHGLGIIRNK